MKSLFNHDNKTSEYEKAYQELVKSQEEEKKDINSKFVDNLELQSKDDKTLGENPLKTNEDKTVTISLNDEKLTVSQNQWEALQRNISFEKEKNEMEEYIKASEKYNNDKSSFKQTMDDILNNQGEEE